MTLRKQLVVLPVSTRIQIIEEDSLVFRGTVYEARKAVGEKELNPSSYVNTVIPSGHGEARILIKTNKSNKVKEDA